MSVVAPKQLCAIALSVILAVQDFPAKACSWSRPPNEAATLNQVREAIARSDVLAEGVVERDGHDDGLSVLRIVRLWRGPRERIIRISAHTSCSMGFTAADIGRRVVVGLWFVPSTQTYDMPIIRQPRLFNRLLRRELRRMSSYTPW